MLVLYAKHAGFIEFSTCSGVIFLYTSLQKKLADSVKAKIKNEIKKKAIAGKIPCQIARKIADNLSVPYKDVGKVADEMQIKITNCELGCF